MENEPKEHMGALYKNVCYPTQEVARAQACSSFDAKVMATTNLYTTECTSTTFTTTTMALCKRTNGGACTTVAQPWPVTPPCDHDGGVTLSYDYFLAVIPALAVIWGLKKLIDLFSAPHTES
jgi:hypothetical protein